MKFLKIFFIFLFFQIIANITYAQTNVAFIDMQYIMDKSLAGLSLKKQLENLHKKNLNEFKKKEDTLKKKNKSFYQKKIFYLKKNFKKKYLI